MRPPNTIAVSTLTSWPAALSARWLPEEIVAMLSRYFDLFSDAVGRYQGVIIQFSGDGVFALWNAPQADEHHATHACRCALELKTLIGSFNAGQRSTGAAEFITRFGIHTGTVVVGSVGAKDRFQYTAVGDAINVASRLEGLNKQFDTTILVNEAVREATPTDLLFHALGCAHVKGREKPLSIFELRS
jgi:adenylate cyclase